MSTHFFCRHRNISLTIVLVPAVLLRPSGSTARALVVDPLRRASPFQRHDPHLFPLSNSLKSSTNHPPRLLLSSSACQSLWTRLVTREGRASSHLCYAYICLCPPTSHITIHTFCFLATQIRNVCTPTPPPLSCFLHVHPLLLSCSCSLTGTRLFAPLWRVESRCGWTLLGPSQSLSAFERDGLVHSI